MKIDRKYIIIGICMIIGAILTATLAFVGPNIITSGTINDTKVVTGNLKLSVTDTTVNISNMAPIRSSNYETEAFKKEFAISSSESTLNGCMKLYLNFNSISEQLKSEYLVYKVVSSTGKVSEGSFKDIADNKLLIYDSDFIETNKSITYTLYIWLRYVEDPTINLASLLGTSINAYVSVNGTDTKESSSCTFDSSKKISYVVTFMNEDDKTVLESRKVSSGSTLNSLPSDGRYYTKANANGMEYTTSSTINDDVMLYVMMEPNSFSTDSWITISKAVKNNNISKYNVGDTKEVDLGTEYGTNTLRVANTTTPSECSTSGFSQTACGFVIEFVDTLLYTKAMGYSIHSWPASKLRTYLNNDIYNLFPSDLKNSIINTSVVSGHGGEDTENFTSTDKLYLLSPKEIYIDFSSTADTAKDLTRTLDYYTSLGVTTSNYSGAIKKYGSSAARWWLRTTFSTNQFFVVNTNGKLGSYVQNYNSFISPAFRIG